MNINAPKEIVLTGINGERLVFVYRNWDSLFFERPCFVLDAKKSVLRSFEGLPVLAKSELSGSFITIKLPNPADYLLLSQLQDSGFRYMTTEIVLEHAKGWACDKVLSSDCVVELKQDTLTEKEAYNLGVVYSQTRFHMDPQITRNKANGVWVEYFRNFVPDENKFMYVARVQKQIIAAISVELQNNGSEAYLFAVSVLPDYQGVGAGSRIMQRILNDFCGCCIRTGTQAGNIAALGFYMKNGFSCIAETSTVLHRW